MKAMNRFMKLAAFLVALSGAVSCGSGAPNENGAEQKSEKAPLVLKLNEAFDNIETIKLSEFGTEINYIPLESDSRCFVSGNAIKDIKVDNGRFIFRSHNSEQVGVHLFFENGKYDKSIGKKGRAKGEFLFNTTISPFVDGNGEQISIGAVKKHVIYTMDGEFVREITMDTLAKFNPMVTGLHHIGDGKFAALVGATAGIAEGEDNLFVAVFDNKGELERLYPSSSEEVTDAIIHSNGGESQRIPYFVMGYSYVIGDEFYYMKGGKAGNENIHIFDSNYRLKPYLTIDFGRYLNMNTTSDYNAATKISHSCSFATMLRLGDNLLLSAVVPAEDFPEFHPFTENFADGVIVYNIKTQRARSLKHNRNYCDAIGFENDLDGGIPFYPFYIKGDKMYQAIDAITFKEAAQYTTSEKVKEIAATLNEESNPVVVVVKLK